MTKFVVIGMNWLFKFPETIKKSDHKPYTGIQPTTHVDHISSKANRING